MGDYGRSQALFVTIGSGKGLQNGRMESFTLAASAPCLEKRWTREVEVPGK